MTVATSNYRNEYHGDCSTTTFAYTFRVLEDSHLDVYVAGVLKTLTADYTVTSADAASGGNVVLNNPPNLGELIVIERDVPLTQTTSYPAGGRFPASSHERALDKAMMAVQAVTGFVRRAIRFAAGSSFATNGWEVDEPRGGYYARAKSDCSGLEWVALESCGTYENPVTTVGDMIRGNPSGVQERLPMGTTGSVLTAMPEGRPDYALGGSVLLRNKTDAQADSGRVFSLDPDCNNAFVVHTPNAVAGILPCGRLTFVTSAAIGDDCQGMILTGGGPVSMLAQGNIARTHFVRRGTTIGAVVTTCVSHEHYRPIPRGSIGLATSHSSGGCVSALLFPTPSQGMQGLATVRNNRSVSNATTPCTKVDLVATGLVLADSCNDVVVVRNPATLTNDIAVDVTNKKNGRDQAASFSAGDVHFYWVYEGACAVATSRSSAKGPDTSGPELPQCETHWAYSHSRYWDGNCLRRHTVRGSWVTFDCAMECVLLNAGAATCETRVSLVAQVPAIAQRVRIGARYADTNSTGAGRIDIGYRLNCIHYTLASGSGGGATLQRSDVVIEVPNNNQELFYRISVATDSPTLTLWVLGYSVPNGDGA